MADLDALYDPAHEQALLLGIVDRLYRNVLGAVHALVAAVFPNRRLPPRVEDAAVRRLLLEAAERVVGIDATTTQALRVQLAEGQRRGYTPWQIAHGVPAEGYRGIDGLYRETWRGRAETIARTEVAWAQTAAALDRFGAAGVRRVRVIEAADTDAACAARAGTVVPLADRPMPAHPNCRMTLAPVEEGEA